MNVVGHKKSTSVRIHPAFFRLHAQKSACRATFMLILRHNRSGIR
jgi:hypothetical protein